MRERLVRISHAVGVVLRGHCLTFVLGSIPEFLRKTHVHWSTTLAARGFKHPAERKRLLTTLVELHGDLIVRTADALGAHFDCWTNIVKRLVEEFDRRARKILWLLLLELDLDRVERGIHDALRGRLLAAFHEAIDELGKHLVLETRIGLELRF